MAVKPCNFGVLFPEPLPCSGRYRRWQDLFYPPACTLEHRGACSDGHSQRVRLRVTAAGWHLCHMPFHVREMAQAHGRAFTLTPNAGSAGYTAGAPVKAGLITDLFALNGQRHHLLTKAKRATRRTLLKTPC